MQKKFKSWIGKLPGKRKKKDNKEEIRKKELLERYNNGEILKADGKTDNKEHIKILEEKRNGSKEITE